MLKIRCPHCGKEIELFEELFECYCSSCGQKVVVSEAEVLKETYKFQFLSKEQCNKTLLENPNDLNSLLSLCLYDYGFILDCNGVRCLEVNENPIFEHELYKRVINLANDEEKEEINKYVNIVNNIQEGFKKRLNSKKPYDVYLCYSNDRTINDNYLDKQMAEKLYIDLTNAGYRTFLEDIKISNKDFDIKDKLIEKAIADSRIMIVIGTNIKFVNSPIVSTKYKKFISLITPENGKKLVTCFKDILAFDFPIDLVKFDNFDLNKPTIKLDLMEYIDNLFENSINYDSPNYNENNGILTREEAVSKHIELLIEDRNYAAAKNLISNYLVSNPESADCYLYLTLMDYKLVSVSELETLNEDLSDNTYFNKAILYEKDEKKKAYLEKIKQDSYYNFKYKAAMDFINVGCNSDAIYILETIKEFDKAKALLDEFDKQKALEEEKAYYDSIIAEFNACTSVFNLNEEEFAALVEKYQNSEDEKILDIIESYKNVVEQTKVQIEENRIKLEKNKELAAMKRKRNKIYAISSSAVIAVILTIVLLFVTVFNPMIALNNAKDFIRKYDYQSAYNLVKDMDSDEAKNLATLCENLTTLQNNNSVNYKWDSNIATISTLPGVKVNINYNINGKITPVQVDNFVSYDKSIQVEGYSIKDWKETSFSYDFDNSLLTIDVIAKLKIEDYLISYELNGGELLDPITHYYVFSKNDIISNPVRYGYVFTGWTDNQKITTPTSDYKIYYFGHNLVLTANWEAAQFKVKLFDPIKKVDIDNLNVSYGSKIQLPTEYNKQQVAAWYYLNDKGEKTYISSANWNFTYSDIIVYPELVQKTYNIRYNLVGGINNEDNPYYFTNKDTITLKDPLKDGYSFVGWTYDNITTPVKNLTLPTSTLNKDIVLVAHWAPKSI